MEINAKLKEFKESLEELVQKEYKKIEEEIELEIKEGIEQELKEYEEKKGINFEKNVQKIEKEFNKQVFNYEMNCKKDIIAEEKRIKEEIKKEAIILLKEYTNKDEYEAFLEKNIEVGISKMEQTENTTIGLVENDILKFGEKIKSKYGFELFEIPNKYIGGVVLENKKVGIYIDNTLLNSIDEKIKFEN